ncbi:MAG: DUF1697 domain-containing protein [Acidobacteriota bacterium]
MQYVGLLRGINVGGRRKVGMTELRQFAADIGLKEPRTLLQSGNLVFGAAKRSTAGLEKFLEEAARQRLDLRTDVIVRSAEEWEEIVLANPFEDAARRDPSHLLVMFLKAPARKGAVEEAARINSGPEMIHAVGRELYIVFPRGIGTSKFPSLLGAADLGTRGTGRNWNTVIKLLTALRNGPTADA